MFRVDEEPWGWRGEIDQHVENIGISGVYLGTGLLVELAVHDPAMNFSWERILNSRKQIFFYCSLAKFIFSTFLVITDRYAKLSVPQECCSAVLVDQGISLLTVTSFPDGYYLQLFQITHDLQWQKCLWILSFSVTSIKIWRIFSPSQLSSPLI